MPRRGTSNEKPILDPRYQTPSAKPWDSNMKFDVLAAAALVLLAPGISPASAGESIAAWAMPVESPRDATYAGARCPDLR